MLMSVQCVSGRDWGLKVSGGTCLQNVQEPPRCCTVNRARLSATNVNTLKLICAFLHEFAAQENHTVTNSTLSAHVGRQRSMWKGVSSHGPKARGSLLMIIIETDNNRLLTLNI